MSRPAYPSPSGPFSSANRVSKSGPSGSLDGARLDNIKTQLDLVLLALESIAGIGSEAMLQAARELGIEEMVSDRVSLWRLRQSNPLRKGSGGRKKLDVEEARSLVLVSCHLARKHHGKIRHAVELLEEVTQNQQPPHRDPLLGDYIDQFSNTYEDRMDVADSSPEQVMRLAFKLLIDLLFYGGVQGTQRLWMQLLHCSDGAAKAPEVSEPPAILTNVPTSDPEPSTKLKRPPSSIDGSLG